MYARSPWPQRRDDAQAVEIVAALPTVARASERRESPIRARSHRVDTLCSPVLEVGEPKEDRPQQLQGSPEGYALARQTVRRQF